MDWDDDGGDDSDGEADKKETVFHGKSGGLFSYEGTHKRDRVLIYSDHDTLEVKFLKFMQFKMSKSHISEKTNTVTGGEMFEWFTNSTEVSRKTFAQLMNKLDWHTLHPQNKTEKIGTQLSRNQLTKLVDLLVNGENIPVTIELVRKFAAIKPKELPSWKDNLHRIRAEQDLIREAQEAIQEAAAEKEAAAEALIEAQRRKDKKEFRAKVAKVRELLRSTVGPVGDHRVRCPMHCLHNYADNTITEYDEDAEEFLQVVLAQTGLAPVEVCRAKSNENESPTDLACSPTLQHLKLSTLGGNSDQLCNALSRAMWGTEMMSVLLSIKIKQEIECNKQWYTQRVGATFLQAATGIAQDEGPIVIEDSKPLTSKGKKMR
jgi:hypothetical protein